MAELSPSYHNNGHAKEDAQIFRGGRKANDISPRYVFFLVVVDCGGDAGN